MAQYPPPEEKRCTAQKTDGGRCGAYAIRGSNVCRVHGGSAPQVKDKAQERLDRLAVPAVKQLGEIIEGEATNSDKIKACKDVLDRAGYPKTERKEHTGKDGEPIEVESFVSSLDELNSENG